MKCISPLRKGLSTHANIITHMRAYVRYCTYNICHNNGMHIQTRTHIYTHCDGLVVTVRVSGCGFVARYTMELCTQNTIIKMVQIASLLGTHELE